MSHNYYSNKDFKQNLRKYEEAEKSGTPIFLDSEDLVLIAEYYQNSGNIVKCKKAANYALELFPGSTQALYLLSRLAILEEHNTEKAEEFIEQVENKDDLEYTYVKGEILVFKEKNEEADKLFKDRCESLDEDSQNELNINAASIFIDYQDSERGEQWLARCSSSDSDDYFELQAQIAISKGEYEKSEKILNELIDKEPYSTIRWNLLASAQYFNKEINKSMSSSEFTLAIDNENVPAIINKANCLVKLGNTKKALLYYKRYLEFVPNDVTVHLMIISALIAENELPEANEVLRDVEKIITDDPCPSADSLENMIHIEISVGNFEKSMEFVEKLDKIDNQQIQACILRGEILIENDHEKEGLKNMDEAIKLSDEDPYIIISVAITLFDIDMTEDAYDKFTYLIKRLEVLGRSETWKEGFSYMAVCAQELHKFEEYKEFVKLATERNPEEAKFILSSYFPKGTEVEEFYKLACEHPEGYNIK